MYRLAPMLLCVAALAARAQELDKLGLPSWMKVGAEFRGRFEGTNAIDFKPGSGDHFYLHRIRLDLQFRPAPGLAFVFQPQHTEAPGYRPPVAANVEDHFDFHQAFAEYVHGAKDAPQYGIRVGRQEVNFGAQRLIGSSNWGNTSRANDAIRLFREDASTRVDLFASTVVQTQQYKLDRFKPDIQLQGLHVQWKKLLPGGLLETYTFRKIAKRENGEALAGQPAVAGRTDIYTPGLRAIGKLPRRFDYNLETAVQAGRVGTSTHSAWAGYWEFGYRVAKSAGAPRILAGYTHASGDGNPRDGHSDTFDQLYPTNHAFYGWADRMSWRNVHEAIFGVDIHPLKKMVMNIQYHSFWLATRQDAFYNFNGRAVVRNPNATSSHVQQELDVNTAWDLYKHLQVIVGLTNVFPGAFLRESTPGTHTFIPYLQWRYAF
ncbi:MAG: alginate export family protein [Acidobacteriota bacterium]